MVVGCQPFSCRDDLARPLFISGETFRNARNLEMSTFPAPPKKKLGHIKLSPRGEKGGERGKKGRGERLKKSGNFE